jgi:hydrogenase maturation factor
MQFITKNPRLANAEVDFEFSNESNDCTVRATCLAMDKPYKSIHKVFAKHGRKNGKGVTLATLMGVLLDVTKNNMQIVASYMVKRQTLASFIKTHPKGRYVVVRRGHAFAVVDGVALDAHSSCCSARSIVKYAYKVGE